jgi:hypothetical protein
LQECFLREGAQYRTNCARETEAYWKASELFRDIDYDSRPIKGQGIKPLNPDRVGYIPFEKKEE